MHALLRATPRKGAKGGGEGDHFFAYPFPRYRQTKVDEEDVHNVITGFPVRKFDEEMYCRGNGETWVGEDGKGVVSSLGLPACFSRNVG